MKNRHWLEMGENVLLFGSGVGSVASVVAQQAFYAVAPLSLLFMVHLVNRRRFEQISHLSTTSTIAQIDQQLTQEINTLRQQLSALPNRLELAGLKKTILQRHHESLTEFRKDINLRIETFEEQGMSRVRKEMSQLREQQAQFMESLNGLSSYLHHLAPTSKLEAVEVALTKLRTELSQVQSTVQIMASEPKPNFASFQDQINHINRRLNNLPPPFDATAIKNDVDSIIKVVGDLVPRRDLARILYDIEQLQQQYKSTEQTLAPLRISLTILKKQLDGLITRPHDTELAVRLNQALSANELSPEAKLNEVQRGFEQISHNLHALEQRFNQIHGSSAPWLGDAPLLPEEGDSFSLDADIASLFSEATDPSDQDIPIPEVHPTGPDQVPSHHALLEGQLLHLIQRVEQIEQRVIRSDRPIAAHSATAPVYDLMLAIPNHNIPEAQAVQSVLEQVLDQTQQELYIVFPSLEAVQWSESIVTKLQTFLDRGGVLELGLGQLADGPQTRFGRWIDPQWTSHPLQSSSWRNTLQQWMSFKQHYPNQFRFKVLGADENFLVSDRRIAVLGIQSLPISSTVFPRLDMGLRTSDPRVIEGLRQRFHQPVIAQEEAQLYFNRAVTLHELGDRQGAIAAYTEALQLDPQDDLAYNNRGQLLYELGDKMGALVDFQQALQINPHNLPACFNQGYVNAELGDARSALANYSRVIELDPTCAAAYFNRGLTRTRMGDKSGAIADYSQVLSLRPQAAIAYFYRGLAQIKLNQTRQALYDLEQSVELFSQQDNRVYLEKAKTMLSKLKEFELGETAQPRSQPSPQGNPTGRVAHPSTRSTHPSSQDDLTLEQIGQLL